MPIKHAAGAFALVVALAVPTNAEAVRMDSGSGEWRCYTGYTNVGDGAYVAQGRSCTYFAGTESVDGGWNPVEDVIDWLWEQFERRFFRRSWVFIPNSPDANPVPATCDSDTLDRWQHANFDVERYNFVHPRLLRILQFESRTMTATLSCG